LKIQNRYKRLLASVVPVAIELQPGYANAYFGLANSLEQKGLNEDAIAAYEECIKSKPDYAAPLAEFARFFSNCPDLRLRNPERAIEEQGSTDQTPREQ
jgi:tetratricopeptide (TPR) repeat protein